MTTSRDFDANTLSDLHKDAYGFRPRSEEFWNAWDSADDDGKQRIWDDLLDAADRAAETEREIQRGLAAKLRNCTPALLPLVNMQHVFESQRLELQFVGRVVVGGNGFGI